MVGYGGSSAGSYLADPTSPIPSHCASIVVTSTVRVSLLSAVLFSDVEKSSPAANANLTKYKVPNSSPSHSTPSTGPKSPKVVKESVAKVVPKTSTFPSNSADSASISRNAPSNSGNSPRNNGNAPSNRGNFPSNSRNAPTNTRSFPSKSENDPNNSGISLGSFLVSNPIPTSPSVARNNQNKVSSRTQEQTPGREKTENFKPQNDVAATKSPVSVGRPVGTQGPVSTGGTASTEGPVSTVVNLRSPETRQKSKDKSRESVVSKALLLFSD